MKVYLAGKVEGRKWQVVKGRSSVEWVSSDGTNHSEHLWGGGFSPWDRIGSYDLRPTVTEQVVGNLRSCQRLVAYVDTPDAYGTIAEIATMAALQKPCFMVVLMPCDPDTNVWPEAAERMADAYWLVSCLPGVQSVTVDTEAGAVDVVHGYLLGLT